MAFLDEPSAPRATLRRSSLEFDLNRVLALSDGIFAFAMTLLVIDLTVPSVVDQNGPLASALVGEWQQLVAYVLAFFIAGNWWLAHQRLFRHLHRCDRSLATLNLAFLMFIAVTPFIVGVLARYGDTAVGVQVYASTQTLAGIVVALMWWYVRSEKDHLMEPSLPDAVIDRGLLLSAVAPVFFGVSILLAWVSPVVAYVPWLLTLAARGVAIRLEDRATRREK